ncbi:CaiB/BaiF CoA-transferase family protein [Actinophytocola oryzae]|uniref:Crotonobetainyl-CoA:carnitine CoA-transferase CaiB-like acyl-CoA transferase n=1 Tax=Actinophytocola oryzae TaxID=502181 RepID=A0A4R7W1T8_9PSEU|nr:CoA transferase [Actinophytocola oryzae]TDV55968.1 crotonobetainyl-CoA:carnitine CoA-transferase CaiB-like acyl-CoA transferase [Actinophytocola oryzae]
MGPPSPLTGYAVVDLSSGIAGAYATKLLADGGAGVTKAEPPEGDPLRTWSASGAPIPPDGDGALFSFLAGAKRSVVVDPDDQEALARLDALLAGVDAVVWSRGTPLAEHPSLLPEEILRRHPHLTVTAITPFGLTGPWRDRPATEFTLQAWSGGIVGLGRGAPDRAPVHVGGQVGEWLAGTYAAAATLVSQAAGRGRLVDLSVLEAQVLCLTYYPVTFFELLGRPFRSVRSLFVPGVSTAKDGLVAIGCATAQQWFDLCAMVGHPEWIDPDQPLALMELAAKAAPELYAWVAERTVAEVRELATAFRIPNAPVNQGSTIADDAQFRFRGTFRTNPRDGFTEPGPPYRLHPDVLREPAPAPRLGEHSADLGKTRPRDGDGAAEDARLPLAGLRVLDMTAFWAGPSSTHLLAMLGAEVIHLESTGRPDGTRLIAGVPATEDQWWERSPIFCGLNTNKKSVTVDFRSERGLDVLRGLIADCGVVVENFTPRVLDQVGLDYEAVRAIRPDVIMVRMPGFGLDGPYRDNAAFAYVIEDVSGLTWLTGHPDQNPVEPYSLGDPNAGLHAVTGLLLALEHRRRTGEGMLVEAAMAEAAVNIAAEQVIEHSAYGVELNRVGNRGPVSAPQNLYRTSEPDEFGGNDSWVAIAVATDEQWAALCAAVDRPDWAEDPGLSTVAGRRAAHDALDEALGRWCSTRTGDEVVTALWAAGVPVAKVLQPHRQTELPQLRERGFFETVGHPVGGAASYSTLPFRFSDGTWQAHRSPAPLLGEHNEEVLTRLGLSADEIAALRADGVIGDRPSW